MAQAAAEMTKRASDDGVSAVLNNSGPLGMVIRKPIGRVEIIVNLFRGEGLRAAGYLFRLAIILGLLNVFGNVDGINRKCPRDRQILRYSPLLSHEPKG